MIDLHPFSETTERCLDAAGLQPMTVRALIDFALGEDLLDGGDVTTDATVTTSDRTRGALVSRRAGVIAGLVVAVAVFERVGGAAAVEFTANVNDGYRVTDGDVLATVQAPTSTLLIAERTALNIVCRLSGIATLTRRWADAITGTHAQVRDTRKTTPGLRTLEKYAVRCGGGSNHRMALSDMALIKDNHIAAVGSIAGAYQRVRKSNPDLAIQIEVDTLAGLAEAIDAGANQVLLDNFDIPSLRAAVDYRTAHAPHVRLEASGGLTLAHARQVAETGVDWIAVGELTHSAPALDIGLDFPDLNSSRPR